MSAPARRWLAAAVLRSTSSSARVPRGGQGAAANRRWSSGGTPDLSDRNLCGWRPAPGEQPQQLPEKEWREMVEAEHARARAPGASDAVLSAGEAAALRKKLGWACRKRGWVEMSALLGAFSEKTRALEEVPDAELRSLERIVQSDDLFLAALFSGKKEVPEEFQGAAMDRLLTFAKDWRLTLPKP